MYSFFEGKSRANNHNENQIDTKTIRDKIVSQAVGYHVTMIAQHFHHTNQCWAASVGSFALLLLLFGQHQSCRFVSSTAMYPRIKQTGFFFQDVFPPSLCLFFQLVLSDFVFLQLKRDAQQWLLLQHLCSSTGFQWFASLALVKLWNLLNLRMWVQFRVYPVQGACIYKSCCRIKAVKSSTKQRDETVVWVKDAIEKGCRLVTKENGDLQWSVQVSMFNVNGPYCILSYSTALAICSLAPGWKPRAAARRQTTPTNKVFQSIRPSGLSLHPSEHKTAPASHRKADITQKGSKDFRCTSSAIPAGSNRWHQLCPPHSLSNLISWAAAKKVRWANSNDTNDIHYQALMTPCHHLLIRSC